MFDRYTLEQSRIKLDLVPNKIENLIKLTSIKNIT